MEVMCQGHGTWVRWATSELPPHATTPDLAQARPTLAFLAGSTAFSEIVGPRKLSLGGPGHRRKAASTHPEGHKGGAGAHVHIYPLIPQLAYTTPEQQPSGPWVGPAGKARAGREAVALLAEALRTHLCP